MEIKVQKHIRVQACGTSRTTAMQEGYCLEWRLWHGPICVLELDQGEIKIGYNLDPI